MMGSQVLLILNSCSSGPSSEDDRITRLHKDALVWDCHNDLVLRVFYEKLDIGQCMPGGYVDIIFFYDIEYELSS